MGQVREENEGLLQKVRDGKEQLAEQEGRLRVAKMNLETAQKQNTHQMAEVRGGTASHDGHVTGLFELTYSQLRVCVCVFVRVCV